MIQSNLKLAWRNIIKHPFHATVNIIGLFAGITFVLLIGGYVWSELEVNKQLKNYKQQYFLQSEWNADGGNYAITTLAPIARRLTEDYPALVANYYRWDGITSGVTKGDKSFREGIQLGDSTVLSMYGFKLLHGNAASALKEPYSAVITEETAIKYFGKKDVVGQVLNIQSFSGGKKDFLVTGVLRSLQKNSVTNLNDNNNNTIFIPSNTYAYFGRADMEDWNNTSIPSYIELKPGASLASVDKAINQLIQTHASDQIKKNLKIHVVPLTKYYIEKDNGLVRRMLLTLSFVALFILLMAVVNFINISISNSGNRMKEIGVRKVLGGIRKQLIVQFLLESLVLVSTATMLALFAYPVVKPFFAEMIGKEIPSMFAFPLYFITIPPVLILLIGLLAGAYPAFALSSVNTVNSLNGKLKTVKENMLLRKSLVGFQFSIALVVLIASAIVTQQVSFFFSQQLGYNKEYIVTSQVPREWTSAGVRKMETIRNEFAEMPQVNNVSLSYEIPNGNNGNEPSVYNLGDDSTKVVKMQALITDENFLTTYGIPLQAGSFFDSRGGLDSGKVVVTEKAIAALGYKTSKEAIGRQIMIPGDPTVFTIKGVANDFHFFSMHDPLAPMIFFNVNAAIVYRYLSFKLKPGNIGNAIEAIQKKWSQLLPGSSFEYSFMDDTLKKVYTSELQLKKAAYTSTVLSFIIALLGILGLIALSIQKRVKEIGIRKVLGASVISIMVLFLKEFLLIMLIAAFIAFPVAYIIMNKWLNNYVYHINISALPFVLSVVVLAMATLVLIGLQTLKAAIANPVKSLRTE